MPVTTIGDMASSLLLRTRSAQLKQTMSTLTQELTTGQTSDINARLGGDYSYLSDIENGLKRLQGYSVAATEAGLLADTMQTSLNRVHDTASSLSASLLATATTMAGPARDHGAEQAEADLTTIMSALNGSVAGRSMFAGTATDQAALGPPSDLLDGLRIAITGQPTVADMRTAAEAWFNDPAGFQATVYTGGTEDLSNTRIGDGIEVSLSLRADDQVFRDLMRETALAALATDPALGLDEQQRTELFLASGQGMLAATDALTRTRADLGYAQSRIEETQVQTASSRMGLEYAKGKLLEADPFETATQLETVQFQLESLYTVTARTSRLSLVNFL